MIRYPYGRQQISEDDISAVVAVLRSPFLTQGPEVPRFETAFASATGSRNAVAVSNGTAALHLAYIGAGLGPKRGLVTSPVTFLATAAAARMLDAPVAFADVDPTTGLVTPETVHAAIARAPFEVGAVTAVHLGGRMCDIVGLRAVAVRHGVILIEDACHAPGATYLDDAGNPVPAGACVHSDFAAFSFHAVKHIAMGEGGAVCCKNSDVAARLARLRSHGMVREPQTLPRDQETGLWFYANPEIGWNYRLTDLQAALGTSQLRKFAENVEKRRALAARYDSLLADLPHIRRPHLPSRPDGHVWHLYAVAIDFSATGKRRSDVMNALVAQGVGSQVHYIPLYRQETYRGAGGPKDFPGAESYYASTLSLPLYPALEPGDLINIASALRDALAGKA
jgi:dTDP-4-amino-4,6-dideoxygalactose transaminase